MERMNCVILEDNILEFLAEIETQLSNGVICCKCKNPCSDKSSCKIAMNNLLTDIKLFRNCYSLHNEEKEDTV